MKALTYEVWKEVNHKRNDYNVDDKMNQKADSKDEAMRVEMSDF